MRRNTVKQVLAEGKPSIGSWLNLGDLHGARLMCRAGFPWLTLDMEHSPIDYEKAATIFAAISDAGGIPLCRPPEATHQNIKRALDAGAWGIVAPMVDTVEQAREIVAACKYPPLGTRSVGAGSHYLNFNTSDGEYKERANDNILVVLQTESPQGVDNAEAIYSVPGVDAIFVGPNDLKWQMRKHTPGGRMPTEEEFEAMLQRVLDAGKKAGCPVGIHTFSIEECRLREKQGFQFIAILSDQGFLAAEAARHVQELGLAGSHLPTGTGAGAVAGGLGKY